MSEQRPLLPPFTFETAVEKVRKAEDAWNTRDPICVALAYTTDSIWRNRSEFLVGREAIVSFLTRKWNRELDYRLIKEIWTCRENRIAVRFAYEWHDDSFNWFRSYGNENWEFNADGLMERPIIDATKTNAASCRHLMRVSLESVSRSWSRLIKCSHPETSCEGILRVRN